jgi:hypothetical protein
LAVDIIAFEEIRAKLMSFHAEFNYCSGNFLREIVATIRIDAMELSGIKIDANSGLIRPAIDNATVVTL